MASTDLVFADEATATAALKDVRSNDTPTNWVLFTYSESGKNTLDLVGKGSGGVEELKSHLNEAKMAYGLVRVTEKIDNSVTVKFVFIIWCGSKVPFVQKGKMTTHKGSITQLIGQFHTDLNCSELSEVDEHIIMQKVTSASGTAVHVKDVQRSEAQTTSSSHALRSSAPKSASSATAKPANVPGSSSVVQFIDEDNIRAAIKAVRANNDDTDWLLLTYEGNSTKIYLEASGSHGLDELLSHLKPDHVQYGLFRTTDTVDNTIAVKFVLILWVGEQVPFTRKARITTHKGEVTAFIGQYHVDCSCSNMNEINEDIIRDLVQRASGTAVHVK
jgi:ssRNA-specific RNase YbeY (16S rRNA maturation enzyme)